MKFNHGDFTCDVDIFNKDNDLTVRFYNAESEQNESQIVNYVYVNQGYGFITLKFKGVDGLLSGFLHENIFSNEEVVNAAIEFVESLSALSQKAYIPHHVDIVKSIGFVEYNGEYHSSRIPDGDDEFQNLMHNLETRGPMYINPYNYSNLISYVLGYDRAVCDNGNSSNLDGFKELIAAKFGSNFSIHWTDIISDYLAENDEDAVLLFFRFYHELLDIRTKKGIQLLKDEYEKISKFKRKRKTNLKWPKKLK